MLNLFAGGARWTVPGCARRPDLAGALNAVHGICTMCHIEACRGGREQPGPSPAAHRKGALPTPSPVLQGHGSAQSSQGGKAG